MGNHSSSNKNKISPEKKLLRQLGEKYPFSDDELHTLIKCYQYKRQSEDQVESFFMELLLGSCTDQKQASGPREALSLIEKHIIPSNFSVALKQTAGLDIKTTTHDENYKDQDVSNCFTSIVTKSSEADNLPDVNDPEMNQFLEGITKLCGRSGLRLSLEVLFILCIHCNNNSSSQDEDPRTKRVKAHHLVYLAYQIGLASFLLTPKKSDGDGEESQTYCLDESMLLQSGLSIENPSLLALSQSLLKVERFGLEGGTPAQTLEINNHDSDQTVSMQTFTMWAETVVPLMSATLPTLMHQVIFHGKPFSPSRQPFLFPDLRDQTSSFFDNPFSPRLFSFACMSLSLGGAWFRLYTTDADGLSFNRLQLALLGYGGPTIMIIEAVGGGLFGAYTSSAWKESKDFYGNSDCFLFQMEPATRVYRPRGVDRNYMYCNSAARSKGYDQLAHGLGFGGTSTQPRLYVSETFDECLAGISDSTFEPGALLPGNRKSFEIQSLEVWGCGGDSVVAEALGERLKARAIIDANIRKAKKVDKAAFLDDFNSGLIESKAFKHRGEIQGREGCDFDPDKDLKK